MGLGTAQGGNAILYTGASAPAPTVYDIDGFDNPATTVAALKAQGAYTVCYISVGTAENWRPDYSSFPAGILGKSNGWPGEVWINTSPSGPYYAQLQAIMVARFQMCKAKGFNALEPDNMDGSENSTGFNITIAQGDAYAEWIAQEAHSLGLAVLQKNFDDQSSVLQPYFDGIIDEQPFQYDSTSYLSAYTSVGKPVYDVEYADQGANAATICPKANALGFNTTIFNTLLDGSLRIACK